MADVDTPHFQLPFKISGGEVVVLEQDSEDEILQTSTTVLYYQRGDRDTIPEYGLREQVLREGGADLREIEAAMFMWDDRSVLLAHRQEDIRVIAEDAIDNVTIDVGEQR